MSASTPTSTITRRSYLLASAALLLEATRSKPAEPFLREETLVIKAPLLKRACFMADARLPTTGHSAAHATPLMVLLHGLGEANDPKLGVRAWPELYGLRAAWIKLISEQRLPPMAALCPFTPRAGWLRETGQLERFCNAITHELREEARPWLNGPTPATAAPATEAPATASPDVIVGCSMGGPLALECLFRAPTEWQGFASVQGAFTEAQLAVWQRRLREHAPSLVHCPLLWLSSTQDPYRKGHEALHRTALELGLKSSLLVPPGPHSQPWLRDRGSHELLEWMGHRVTTPGDPG